MLVVEDGLEVTEEVEDEEALRVMPSLCSSGIDVLEDDPLVELVVVLEDGAVVHHDSID